MVNCYYTVLHELSSNINYVASNNTVVLYYLTRQARSIFGAQQAHHNIIIIQKLK